MGSKTKSRSIDTATAKVLPVADDCFEVDDIAAFDPIVAPASAPVPKRAGPAAAEDADMEIELSADDMDMMLADDVVLSPKAG